MANEENPVAIITGGINGIGRAITLTLARRGFRVVAFGCVERQIGSAAENGCEETRRLLNAEGLHGDLLDADVSVVSDVVRVVDFAIERYGRIDALVNNAAIHPRGTVLSTSKEIWDKVLAVNVGGVFNCVRATLPYMIRAGGGSIVNIGSGSGWGRSALLAYCASKGGVYALTMALARDHLIDHVSVNMVIPGGTSQTGTTAEGYGLPGFEEIASQTVTGKVTLPQDIANAVAFLLSEEAQQISGTVLDVGCFFHQGGPPALARSPTSTG